MAGGCPRYNTLPSSRTLRVAFRRISQRYWQPSGKTAVTGVGRGLTSLCWKLPGGYKPSWNIRLYALQPFPMVFEKRVKQSQDGCLGQLEVRLFLYLWRILNPKTFSKEVNDSFQNYLKFSIQIIFVRLFHYPTLVKQFL